MRAPGNLKKRKRKDNVVTIKGEPVPQFHREAKVELVRYLVELTERVQSGDITGFAGVLCYADKSVSWTRVGIYQRVDAVGALEGLKFEMTREMVE